MANLVNFGILPLVFVNEDDIELLNQGDSLLLDTATLSSVSKYMLVNKTTGFEVLVASPLTQEELNYVKAGGRLNWIKMKS